MMLTVVITLAAAYLLIAALLYVAQARLVYFPTRSIEATPAACRLAFEDVAFAAADGTKLSGWFVPAENPRGTLLFCHGNAGNISHRLESIEIFRHLRLNTFIFDYRGYGTSAGKPTERGTYLDAEAAWNYLVKERNVRQDQIVVFGRSLGGAIAAWLAKEHTPKALILESTFTSLPDVGARLYPFLPVRLLARFRYSTRDYVRQVRCPVLVVHSPEDDLIPYRFGRELFGAAAEPKEFLELAGSHNEGFLLAGPRYVDGLDDFLSKHLGR